MTLEQRDLVRQFTRLSTTVLSNDDISIYLDMAEDEDKSDGDSYCIAYLACSMIAQNAKWCEVIRLSDGTTTTTADTFINRYKQRLKNIDKAGVTISDTVY